jgi:hypothetical protein
MFSFFKTIKTATVAILTINVHRKITGIVGDSSFKNKLLGIDL